MAPIAFLIALAILLLGNLVFLVQAGASLTLGGGLVLLALAGAGLGVRGLPRVDWSQLKALGACIVLALAICLLGGQGHLVFASEDWPARDAVLHDLVRQPWPVRYGDAILRAPVGFYMLPAAAGRLFGMTAAYVALVAQNALLLGAVLALMTGPDQKARGRWTVLAVVFAFGGLDLLGECLRVAMAGSVFPLHMEHWSGLEYSSFVTDLFWAPNHALPALAFVAGYRSWRRGEIAAPALALLTGAAVLWSPLAVAGALPFMLLAAIVELKAGKVRPREAAGVVLLGLALVPVAIYLSLASGAVPHGWTWTEPKFRLFAPLFYALEVLPMLALLLLRDRDDPRRPRIETALIVGLMLLLPLYRIGVSNDFMMRASIPALAMAALVVGERIAFQVSHRRWSAAAPALAMLAVAAMTPVFEIARVFVHPPTPIPDLDLPHAWAASDYAQASLDAYVAPKAALAPWSRALKAPPGR